MSAHPPTIILRSLSKTLLLGLDTLALTPSPRFTGFTYIPPGWHFIYAGSTASLSSRTGYWIQVSESLGNTPEFLHVLEWDPDTETLRPVTSTDSISEWRVKLVENRDIQKGLLPYRIDQTDIKPAESSSDQPPKLLNPTSSDPDQPVLPEPVDFAALTSHVTPTLLSRLTNSPAEESSWMISTTSCAPEDRDDIPGLDSSDRKFGGASTDRAADDERELQFLGINLKQTWREGAVGEERTKGARDRSWALGQIAEAQATGGSDGQGVWGSNLLGEMEVCFLMVLLLANWSCLEEWKRVLELVLTSQEAINEHSQFFEEFLEVLLRQLQRCGDVEGGLFDVKGEEAGWLKNVLRRFKRGLDEVDFVDESNVMQRYMALESWLNEEWGWELDDSFVRKGVVELEDGERIELEVADMEAEDERGEYAPVVVEL